MPGSPAEIKQKMETLPDDKEEEIVFKTKTAQTLNLHAQYYWKLGRKNKFGLDFGYAVPIGGKDNYEIVSDHQLNDVSKLGMRLAQPGGLLFGLGFTFGI
ncbi:MAG: hypothetical protein HC896_14535 [Bacteroidales bacterium]|nr:hypothetical protein [Bacteroidales bacterium]